MGWCSHLGAGITDLDKQSLLPWLTCWSKVFYKLLLKLEICLRSGLFWSFFSLMFGFKSQRYRKAVLQERCQRGVANVAYAFRKHSQKTGGTEQRKWDWKHDSKWQLPKEGLKIKKNVRNSRSLLKMDRHSRHKNTYKRNYGVFRKDFHLLGTLNHPL